MATTEIQIPFADREAAARTLAGALAKYRESHPLILAIPRGAVPMAEIIAQRLHGELDVVLTRKLSPPGAPEYAIGAVDETGWVYLTPEAKYTNPEYLQRETATQLALLKQRRARYTPLKTPIDPAQRIVIVVDDGIATGSTMIAALHAARAKKPALLVCAVPVAAADSLDQVRALADEVVCLYTPEYFDAVGAFYRHFSQVDDAEVEQILKRSRMVNGTASSKFNLI